jgi:hypothetical protein
MEKKLEIKDTEFRTVVQDELNAAEKDTALMDEGPQGLNEPAQSNAFFVLFHFRLTYLGSNIWIHLYYGIVIWFDRVHEFTLFLTVASTFPQSLILASLIGIVCYQDSRKY